MGYDAPRIETRWRKAWEKAGCFRAPRRPTGPKFFNYDSGPFPNGPLHLGHVRTYALGDATARYQRLLGKCVLYATEWDAFGLPNEIAAIASGSSPREHTERWIATMGEQLRALGISYDWSRVRSTCAPEYVRETQRLFLELLASGRIERREAELPYCPSCATALARMQVGAAGECWRCRSPVERRVLPQWFVLLSRDSDRLREGLDRLDGWSETAKSLLRGFIGRAAGPQRVHDWSISRQRRWGTPIPIVHCAACGAVPLPDAELPWFGAEDGAAACPRCGSAARRESDTLDCFFDDIWCFLACLVRPDRALLGSRAALAAWLPVDRFHSGLDTFFYLHLHRFLGLVLHERGVVASPELIGSYVGNELVLAGGRKMSKHLGNAVSAADLLATHGADALRLGLTWAAAPRGAIDWRPEVVDKARRFLDSVHDLFAGAAPACARAEPAGDAVPSRAARDLRKRADEGFGRVGRFIEEYRMNAAIETLAVLVRDLRAFLSRRLDTGRLLGEDAAALRGILCDLSTALSPFAPFLAEECRALLGERPFAATARWPGGAGS